MLVPSTPDTQHGAADIQPRSNIDEAARFLLALPNLRFANSRIPRLIHHTWKVSDASQFPPMVTASVASFRSKNDAVLQLVWSDQACADLVDAEYPSLSRLFRELGHPILRADLFRYMVLNTFGGVYSDVDTLLLKAVDEWVPAPVDSSEAPVSLIIGIEADSDSPDWADWYARRLQWCQWTVACAADHPVCRYVIDESVRRIRAGEQTSVMELTGPGVWTDSVNRWLERDQGHRSSEFIGLESPVRVGDALLLPITGFSPGLGHMGSKPIDSSEALVEHQFMGSWKVAADDPRRA
jgi:alpha 1,6-mannosyltransferase